MAKKKTNAPVADAKTEELIDPVKAEQRRERKGKPLLDLKIEYLDPESLTPYFNNTKAHPIEQVDKIAGSIAEFNFDQPIVVDEQRVIIKGHGRREAAIRLGMRAVPVIVRADLTDAQKKASRIADNRVAESEWDKPKLSLELQGLALEDFQMDLTGFDVDELKDLLSFKVEELPFADKTPPEAGAPPEAPVTILGDVWVLGNHRLMCGDSRIVDQLKTLLDGEKADMMFTDPPYGVGYEGGHFYSGDVNIKRKREALEADQNADIYAEFLPVALGFVDGPCYMWYANTKSYEVFKALHENKTEIHACLIWHKTNAKYAALNAQYKNRHEPCVYFKPKGSNLRWCGASDESTLWEVDRDAQNTFHPTQKPIELAERALKNHTAKTVLDCFGGSGSSGSTLIAAEKVGRSARVMEISPGYVDVIIKRWQEFTGQEAFLVSEDRTFDEIKERRHG